MSVRLLNRFRDIDISMLDKDPIVYTEADVAITKYLLDLFEKIEEEKETQKCL